MFNRLIGYLQPLTHSVPRGQGLAEYALILALIAILAITALVFMGGAITSALSNVGKKI